MKRTIVFIITVVFTAVMWGATPMNYQIVNATGGRILVSTTDAVTYTLTAVPNVGAGYSFYKWSDNVATAQRTVTASDGQTLTAQFTLSWTVTFDGIGTSITVPRGNSIRTSDVPPCTPPTGKIFAGWATTQNAAKCNINDYYTPTGDITLYPFWLESTPIRITSDSSIFAFLEGYGIRINGYTDVITPHLDFIIENGGRLLSWGGVQVNISFTFKSLTINPGGTYVKDQTNGGNFTFGQVIMEAGETDEWDNYFFRYPCLHNEKNNSYEQSGADTLYYDYLLSKRQQYPLCLPRDVRIADIRYTDGTPAVYGTDFKVAYYDGAKRATGASGWAYLSDTTTFLKRGIGYTVYAKPLPGQSYSRLRFPMELRNSSGKVTKNFQNFVCTTNAVSLPAEKPNDAGWHLVGNSMFSYLTQVNSNPTYLKSDSPIGLLKLQEDGTYQWVAGQRYVVIPNHNGKSYSSEMVGQIKIAPFNIFFMQVGEGEKIQIASTFLSEKAPARMLAAQEEPKETMVGVILSQNNNTQNADKMGVLIGENFTEAYEINADLQKFGHNEGVNVYAWADKSELAFIALNEPLAQHIPVGFIAPKAGQYTFSYNSAFDPSNVQSVYLYDSETQTTTNLLTEEYSFNVSSAQTNNSRFVLSVGLRKTATDIDMTTYEQCTMHNGKFIHNGQLYIVRDNMMYNAQGQAVKQ